MAVIPSIDFSSDPDFDFFHKSRNSCHEKFVKVAAADGDEFNSFQQRMPQVSCFLKDACVKSYPAEFPV